MKKSTRLFLIRIINGKFDLPQLTNVYIPDLSYKPLGNLMKRMKYLLFFIVIAVAVLGVLGIISLPSLTVFPDTTEPKANTSFIMLNKSDPFTGISFDDVASRIPVSMSGMEENATATPSIRMIQGYGLDPTGNASSWDVIICQSGQTTLVTYNHHGERTYNWSGTCPEQDINLGRIITPRDLFLKNRDRIFLQPDSAANESRELALAGSTYFLTITSTGRQRDLRFDAITGALTSTND
ncbi:hypothetical protein [Methanoregula formicica]|nr:hypothetical protein [Methanoregula formicica]